MKKGSISEMGGSSVWIYAALFLLAAGTAAGSVYLMRSGAETAEGVRAYLARFFETFAANKNNAAVFKNSLVSNLICAGIIFTAGFFRFGCILTGALLLRRGFVMGFTAASFFKFYGLRGMFIMLSTMPTVLITIPAMLLFSAVSVNFSLNRERKEKKFIFSYIFFLILTISIFCVASLSEGYLTTTFMGFASPK